MKAGKFAGKFQVKPGSKFKMSDVKPSSSPGIGNKKDGLKETDSVTEHLADLQRIFYAENKRALLVVLQAMDTGGKDGTIRHVFGPLNPQGVRVTSFKSPGSDELAHDYLWRIHANAPKKGMIRIFNRSHYEDVLIARVHNLAPTNELEKRYGQINDFEKYLTENNIVILKFFLHISKQEQKERLQARLDHKHKNWKFNSGDLAERKLWSKYQQAYKKTITECSTPWAPWHVIPADRKWYRNWAVAKIVEESLENMDLKYPKPQKGLDKISIE